MTVPAGPSLDVLVPTRGRPAALAVTLTGLASQSVRDFRLLVSDQSEGAASYENPVVQAVVRVLEHHGSRVELTRHLPARGIAEHRHALLAGSAADLVLFLDDDVLLEPDSLARLLTAQAATGAGFVGMAMQGLSYVADVRPHEHEAYEPWTGGTERVRKGDLGWERWRLHNAANLVHLAARLGVDPVGWTPYKVAWAAGCVLFNRAALVAAGGFEFWSAVGPDAAGEDVVAQLRVLESAGGFGILPSGAYHLELPTTVTDRRVDAYAVVLEREP